MKRRSLLATLGLLPAGYLIGRYAPAPVTASPGQPTPHPRPTVWMVTYERDDILGYSTLGLARTARGAAQLIWDDAIERLDDQRDDTDDAILAPLDAVLRGINPETATDEELDAFFTRMETEAEKAIWVRYYAEGVGLDP